MRPSLLLASVPFRLNTLSPFVYEEPAANVSIVDMFTFLLLPPIFRLLQTLFCVSETQLFSRMWIRLTVLLRYKLARLI